MSTDMNAVVLTGQLDTAMRRIKAELDKVSAAGGAIDAITIDGTTQTITNKTVALDLSAYAKKTDIAGVYTAKGTVANFAALPNDASAGDVYNITAAGGTDENGVAIKAGDNVVKTSTGWDNLGGTVDLSNYVQKDGSKVLSTEDYTTAEKTKLGGISEGAQVNVIETVQVNGTALTVSGKAVNIDLSGKADKVSNPTAGHFASLDANGNITDSGKAVALDADISTMLTSIFGASSVSGT